MNWLGDYEEDFTTVAVFFTTHDSAGAPVAPLSAFEEADVKIYKDGNAAEKTSTNGLTMTSPFDSITGLHRLLIDTSNDTGDASFWQAGHVYSVVLSPDTETVNSQTVLRVIGTFGLALRTSAGSPPSAGTIAAAVWDLDATGHQTQGTFGQVLGDSASDTDSVWSLVNGGLGSVPPSAASIAAAVWDLDATAHQTQGTFGQAIGDPGADTDSIWALANTNLDATVSSRLASSSISLSGGAVTVGTNNDKTGYTLSQSFPSNFSSLSINGSGQVDVIKIAGTTQTARDLGTSVLLSSGTGTGQISLSSGTVTVGTNNDKTGYTASTVSDKTGYALTSAYDPAKTAAQAGDAMALTTGERNSTADALLDRTAGVETGWTFRQAMRIILSALAGKASGLGGTTAAYRDMADSKDRISATVDSDGNRSAVTRDAT